MNKPRPCPSRFKRFVHSQQRRRSRNESRSTPGRRQPQRPFFVGSAKLGAMLGMPEGAMRLTPPTRYTFFSSLVLGLAALAIYFLDAFGIVGGMFHFAFWVAIAAWVL